MQQAEQDQDEFEAEFNGPEQSPEDQQALAMQAVAQSLAQRLSGEFARRKAQRSEIESRWHSDIRRYNGIYEPEIEQALKERKFASRIFVPLTRRICNIVEARLGDLLFPTDDRNFVVEASPVPELNDAEELSGKLAPDAMVQMGGQTVTAKAVKQSIADIKDEAKRKAANMQRVIDDQLKEADYPTQARKVIHDAIKLGTGVIKGPFVLAKVKKKWTVANGVAMLQAIESMSPTIKRIDPWNFYPRLGASEIDESEDFYELHRMSMAQLAELATQPGFDAKAIAEIIQGGAMPDADSNLQEQRVASGTVGVDDNRFNIVEYTGSLTCEELIASGAKVDDDPLMAYNASVWFSEFTGKPVKATIRPLDTGDVMYSVFNWQPDSASLFGFGLPYEIADMQVAGNSVFRAAMDNMGLSAGPQIVVNDKRVQPMNGSWTIEPNKLWGLNDASTPVQNVFGFFQIASQVNELLALFNSIKALADEIGGPQLAMQGAEAPNYTQTATGMSIAYNAANIWMRRGVKLYDDQVTVPRVRAFIDWNMQHNPDEEIKGDMAAVARGTSALMEAEGQVQRIQLLQQASQAAGIPIRKMINQLRQMALAMRLDPDELLPTDDEIKEIEANQTPPANPELERMDRDDKREQQRGDREVQMFNAELVTKAQMGSGI